MDDLPRQKLAEMIRRFGREIAGDARRCEALLRDACPQHKQEIFVLVSAAKESVGVELLGSSGGMPKEAMFSRLTKRLHENLGLPENLARWAVESWALALGVASLTDFRFPFKCPGCGAAGTMPTRLAGQKVSCPKCKSILRISADGQQITIEVARGASGQPASDSSAGKAASTGQDDLLSEFPQMSAEEIFRQTLRRVLADGIVTDEERAEVQNLRRTLGLARDVAAAILEEVKKETRPTVHVVGIDLGTTFSAIAVVNDEGKPEIIPNREGERITPSVVLFDGDAPIVGTLARQSAVARPLNVVQFVKRQMGNPSWKFRTENGETFTPEEISAIILKRLKEDAEATLGVPIRDAVITVPAYFDDAQRKATHDAGRIAGLNVLRIINEPTAAALAYAFGSFRKTVSPTVAGATRPELREQTVLVYDLGGGTFDVTIMRLGKDDVNVVATGGDKNLGGFDWDNAIMKFLNEEFKTRTGVDLCDEPEVEQQLRDKAEVAKKTLSARDKTSVLLAAAGKTASVVLTRADFEAMTASLLNRTTSIMGFTLEDAGLQWSQVDKILLTGGSTRMPAVPAMIERLTGKHPSSELHPDEVVALGAALQGTILELKETKRGGAKEGKRGSLPVLKIQDINSHSLGVVALNENNKDANSIVLKKGTPIPCSANDTFCTVVDRQDAIHVQVTEGEDTELAYVKIVGEGTMKIPPYPRGSPIEVRFEYDHDGIIHVQVFDLTGKAALGELHIKRTSNLTEQDVQDKIVKVGEIQVG